MSTSAIEWTDETWNPVRGCTKVSPGCAHCYAETFAERFRNVKGHPYEQGFDLRLVPEKLEAPLHWQKPRRVFVNSMSDLFHESVPDEYIDQVFAVMAMAPQHTFQVLTKRAERMARYLNDAETPLRVYREFALLPGFDRIVWPGLPLPNVWLGVSVENQHFADARKQPMQQLADAGWITWVSYEPALEHVDFWDWLPREVETSQTSSAYVKGIRWLVAGGESGAGARACDLEWLRSVQRQCGEAGVAFFLKQLGAKVRVSGDAQDALGAMLGQHRMTRMRECDGDWRVIYRHPKGGDPAEWPEDLRVREYPTVRA